MTIRNVPEDSCSFNKPSRRNFTELRSNSSIRTVSDDLPEVSQISVTKHSADSPGYPSFEHLVHLSRKHALNNSGYAWNTPSPSAYMKDVVMCRAAQICKILRQWQVTFGCELPIDITSMDFEGNLELKNWRRFVGIETIPDSTKKLTLPCFSKNGVMFTGSLCETSESIFIRGTTKRRPRHVLGVSFITVKTPVKTAVKIQTRKAPLDVEENLAQYFRNHYGSTTGDVKRMLDYLALRVSEIEQVVGLFSRRLSDISIYPGVVRMKLGSLKQSLRIVISGRRRISQMFEHGAGLYEAMMNDHVRKGNGLVHARSHQLNIQKNDHFPSRITRTKERDAKLLPPSGPLDDFRDREEIKLERDRAFQELFRVRKGMKVTIQGHSKQSTAELGLLREQSDKELLTIEASIAKLKHGNALQLTENGSMHVLIGIGEDAVYESKCVQKHLENEITELRNRCQAIEKGLYIIPPLYGNVLELLVTVSGKNRSLKRRWRLLSHETDQSEPDHVEMTCINDSFETATKHVPTGYIQIPQSHVCEMRNEVERLREARMEDSSSHSPRLEQVESVENMLFDRLYTLLNFSVKDVKADDQLDL